MAFDSSGSARSRSAVVTGRSVVDPGAGGPECDVVVTWEHEYFVLKGVCVAVRERCSGRFVRQDLSTGVVSIQARETVRGMPRAGEWLCLERGGALSYVGPVIACERRQMPAPRIVAPVIRRAKLD